MIATTRHIGCTCPYAHLKFVFRRRFEVVRGQPRKNVHAFASAAALSSLLDRKWLLKAPDSQLCRLQLPAGDLCVVQDDLLHPILGGNKLRKLDALLPEVMAAGCTDLLTCGGLQSAHTAAVAAACAEQGIKAHLLVRGERPAVPTGFHLLARMYGKVTYVSRSQYANRDGMMEVHAQRIMDSAEHTLKLRVLPEGASEPAALLGCIRLIHWLSQPHALGQDPLTLVVDCGTGTTATGLAVGIKLLKLPWRVHGVMLAGTAAYYTDQQITLTASFCTKYLPDDELLQGDLPLAWVERLKPRALARSFRMTSKHVNRYSIERYVPSKACKLLQVARHYGILVDPIYSLAAWEAATSIVQSQMHVEDGCRIVMLHTGGALGLQGIAQRYPDWF